MCIILVEFHFTTKRVTPSLQYREQQWQNDEKKHFDLLEPKSMTTNNNIMMTSTFLFTQIQKCKQKTDKKNINAN
jgi:hypothetical protein